MPPDTARQPPVSGDDRLKLHDALLVRAAAMQSLGQTGGADAARVLAGALSTDRAATVRLAAARALDSTFEQSDEARRALEKAAVADVSPEVRARAAGAATVTRVRPK
jgi:HEAT repeat protein